MSISIVYLYVGFIFLNFQRNKPQRPCKSCIRCPPSARLVAPTELLLRVRELPFQVRGLPFQKYPVSREWKPESAQVSAHRLFSTRSLSSRSSFRGRQNFRFLCLELFKRRYPGFLLIPLSFGTFQYKEIGNC